jgi:hypothetical protein
VKVWFPVPCDSEVNGNVTWELISGVFISATVLVVAPPVISVRQLNTQYR